MSMKFRDKSINQSLLIELNNEFIQLRDWFLTERIMHDYN